MDDGYWIFISFSIQKILNTVFKLIEKSLISGEPQTDLNDISAITEFTEEQGWVNFIFESGSILNTNEFFVVIENLDDEGEKRNPDQLASIYPIYMLKFFTLSKQSVYLSNAGLQSWDKKNEDPVFRLSFAYEK